MHWIDLSTKAGHTDGHTRSYTGSKLRIVRSSDRPWCIKPDDDTAVVFRPLSGIVDADVVGMRTVPRTTWTDQHPTDRHDRSTQSTFFQHCPTKLLYPESWSQPEAVAGLQLGRDGPSRRRQPPVASAAVRGPDYKTRDNIRSFL